jgi:hypothetical protein
MNKRVSGAGIAAETLAIQALAYLAGDPERLGRFLAISGIDPATIRSVAAEPGFLAGVLDHVCAHEDLLLALAHHLEVAPGEITHAQAALSGRQWERETP